MVKANNAKSHPKPKEQPKVIGIGGLPVGGDDRPGDKPTDAWRRYLKMYGYSDSSIDAYFASLGSKTGWDEWNARVIRSIEKDQRVLTKTIEQAPAPKQAATKKQPKAERIEITLADF